MDAAIYRLISEREKIRNEAPKDFLTRLVAAKDPDDGAGLNATEVRDEVITIFMAGHETTAVSMTWVWYLLSQHPAEEARLHEELRYRARRQRRRRLRICRICRTRAWSSRKRCACTRRRPGCRFGEAQQADEVCGFKVTSGTAGFNLAVGTASPPPPLGQSRALRSDAISARSRAKSGRASAYLPFGGGPRVCIGATLAMTEATLILAVLAQRFRLRLKEPQEIKLQTRITLRPKNGMITILERRPRHLGGAQRAD